MDNNSHHPLPHRTMQHRRGELTAGDLRLAQLAFERGAADEEFVHFGDDAFLFGEGWEGNQDLPKSSHWNCELRNTSSTFPGLFKYHW